MCLSLEGTLTELNASSVVPPYWIKGEDAKINGVNSINIVGEAVKQKGETLTIDAYTKATVDSLLGVGDMAVVKGLFDPIGGRTYAPDESGTVQVPYAPLGGISQNGKLLNPDSMGIVTIEAAEVREWVGTQAEFDKLTVFDEKTTYYIYD